MNLELAISSNHICKIACLPIMLKLLKKEFKHIIDYIDIENGVKIIHFKKNADKTYVLNQLQILSEYVMKDYIWN